MIIYTRLSIFVPNFKLAIQTNFLLIFEIPVSMFQNQVETFSRRVEAVTAKGGPTPYLLPMVLKNECSVV